MKKFLVTITAAALCLAGTAWASGQGGVHWGYSGDTGPAHWGELAPAFAACGEGRSQSPIDIRGAVEANLPAIEFAYDDVRLHIVNNGHTIKAAYDDSSSITIGGQSYKLLQFHFHSPSENTVNGRSFPLEAHLVHADAAGKLAVVAVMFEQGAENPVVGKVWRYMPAKANATMDVAGLTVNAVEMLPAERDYYTFDGSLTTPPCTEGVRWLVLKDPVQVSPEQIAKFERTMHHANNRPVQPLYGRTIYK